MERPYKFKTTKVMYKALPGHTEDSPKYKTSKIETSFICDLDDIKFVDYAVKDNGELYKTKCVITHVNKGDIMINHKFDDINNIVKNKYKTSYVTIKGFKR